MLRAAIVGATGIVGQQFIVALHKHPWIKITLLAASERSAGRTYRESLTDAKIGCFPMVLRRTPGARGYGASGAECQRDGYLRGRPYFFCH